MKYISKITLGLGLCISLLVSCKDDNGLDANQGLSLDKETISIGPDGGVESILVSSGQNWVSSSSQPWVAVSPANGFGSVEGSLAIDSTLEVTARTAQVRYRQEDNQEKYLTITQFGYGKQIIPSESEIQIKSSDLYDNRFFDLTISTNVKFKVDPDIAYEWGEELTEEDKDILTASDLEGWIEAPTKTEVDLDRKDRPRTVTIRFKWSMNTAPYKRVAKIKLVPSDSDDKLVDQDGNPTGEVVVTVVQDAAVKITDDRQGDSIAVVMINEKLQTLFGYDFSDKMENWENVTLWEEGDEDMPEGAQGRIRSLSFMLFDLKEGETLPKEIKYLKYLEELSFQSNTNRQTRIVGMGEEVCELEHLKRLAVVSFGLDSLPKNFDKLAGTLEYLDLTSNNFPSLSTVTDVVNKEKFTKLVGLDLSGCRRNDTTKELQGATGLKDGDLGMHIELGTAEKRGEDFDDFMDLLLWDKLEYLGLSYMLIEGELPTDAEMFVKTDSYKNEDFYTPGIDEYKYGLIPADTCAWLLSNDRSIDIPGKNSVKGNEIARVLPKAMNFSINLNFITGELPNWLLLHPFFMQWNPEQMVMNQWEKGKDSNGTPVGFSNAEDIKNSKYTFYYGDGTTKQGDDNDKLYAYPGYYNKYVGGGVEWKKTDTSTGTGNGESSSK